MWVFLPTPHIKITTDSQPVRSAYWTLPSGSALHFRLKNKKSHWFWFVHERSRKGNRIWNCQCILKLVLQHNLIPVDLSCLVLTVDFFPCCNSLYAQNFSNAELVRKKKITKYSETQSTDCTSWFRWHCWGVVTAQVVWNYHLKYFW